MSTGSNQDANVKVDLIADPAQLDAGLTRSQTLIETFGRRITESFQKITELPQVFGRRLMDAFAKAVQKVKEFLFWMNRIALIQGQLTAATTSYNTVLQTSVDLLSRFISKLQASLEQQKDLALSVKLTGQFAGYTAKQLDAHAQSLEKLTSFSKEATKSAQTLLLHFRDIRGKNFLEATKAVQDMATALKMDLAVAAQEVGAALQDPINALHALEQRNVFFTRGEKDTILTLLEQNKVMEAQKIILDKLHASFGGAAKTLGETFSGVLEKTRNRLNTVGQAITNHLLKAFEKLFQTTTQGGSLIEAYVKKIESMVPIVTELIDNWVPKVQEFAAVVKDKLVVAFNWMLENTIIAFSAMQIAYENFGKVVQVVFDKVQLQFERMKRLTQWIFTQVIPESLRVALDYLIEFGGQFGNALWRIMHNIGQFLSDAFTKLAEFVGNTFVNILQHTMIEGIGGIMTKFGQFFGGPLGKKIIEQLGIDEKGLKELSDSLDLKSNLDFKLSNYNPLAGVSRYFNKKGYENIRPADFTARQESEKEKDLRKEIANLENELADATQKRAKEISDSLSKRVKELIEASKKADEAFQKEYGKTPQEATMKDNANPRFDREEAREKERRDREKELAKTSSESSERSIIGLEQLWEKVSGGANNETDRNTKALQDNTEAMKELIKTENSDKAKKALKTAGKAVRRRIAQQPKKAENAAEKKKRLEELRKPLRLSGKTGNKNKPKENRVKEHERRQNRLNMRELEEEHRRGKLQRQDHLQRIRNEQTQLVKKESAKGPANEAVGMQDQLLIALVSGVSDLARNLREARGVSENLKNIEKNTREINVGIV